MILVTMAPLMLQGKAISVITGYVRSTIQKTEDCRTLREIKLIMVDPGVLYMELEAFRGIDAMFQFASKPSMPSNTRLVDHFMIFENVTVADGGIYICTARNEIGTDIKVVHVIVKARPHVLHTAPVIHALSSVKVDYYSSTKLFCNATGFPTPSLTWKFHNVNII
ncbi:unnamed protein product [Mytilus edulis]|uniref:Ig-like domain-containing protein n=1 Tax=Mytilus edulis TaxID=6550 RepID=A0A8S3Q4S9_MYTED|nr:unnamed protein product [Mytilus edulis]